MSKSKVSASGLLNAAQASGRLSQQAHEILVENLTNLTTLGAQGPAEDSLTEDRVTLFVPVIDCTGSRAHEANLMRDEYNRMLDALNASKGADTILVSSWLFGTRIDLLHGFVPLDQATRLDSGNYDPDGMTAMFDAILDAFTSTAAYAQSLMDSGYRVKIVIVVITDGDDNASRSTSADVRVVAKDLVDQEVYILSMVAFGQGYAQTEAGNMGFPNENVIEYGQDDKAVRKAFQLVSDSVIRASQTQIGGSNNFFAS